jgi:hypothetical protein
MIIHVRQTAVQAAYVHRLVQLHQYNRDTNGNLVKTSNRSPLDLNNFTMAEREELTKATYAEHDERFKFGGNFYLGLPRTPKKVHDRYSELMILANQHLSGQNKYPSVKYIDRQRKPSPPRDQPARPVHSQNFVGGRGQGRGMGIGPTIQQQQSTVAAPPTELMSEAERKLQATRLANAELVRQVKEREEEIRALQEAARKQSEKERIEKELADEEAKSRELRARLQTQQQQPVPQQRGTTTAVPSNRTGGNQGAFVYQPGIEDGEVYAGLLLKTENKPFFLSYAESMMDFKNHE